MSSAAAQRPTCLEEGCAPWAGASGTSSLVLWMCVCSRPGTLLPFSPLHSPAEPHPGHKGHLWHVQLSWGSRVGRADSDLERCAGKHCWGATWRESCGRWHSLLGLLPPLQQDLSLVAVWKECFNYSRAFQYNWSNCLITWTVLCKHAVGLFSPSLYYCLE